MKYSRTILLSLGLAAGVAYVVLFYATRLPTVEDQLRRAAAGPSLEENVGEVERPVWRRVDFFQLLLFPELLLQRWFGDPVDVGLLDRVPVLLIAGVIVAYAAGLGWLLIALLRVDRHLTRLETFVFSTAVGLNVVSTYVLAVGLCGWLGNPLVFAVPAALTLAAAGRLRWRRAMEASSEDRKSAKPTTAGGNEGDWLGTRWLWLGAPFVLMILLGGMLPPVDFDVREYHLQVPKEFFQQGRITFLPHNVYGNMALGTEMLSLLAMVIAGDWWLGALAGKTVIAAMGPLAALGLFAAGRRFFSTTAGVVAALVYVSTPWIIRVSTLGLVEGAVAYYLLLAVYAVLLCKKEDAGPLSADSPARKGGVVRIDENLKKPRPPGRGYSPLLLAGYLAGGAVSCKYPAVLFVVLPLAAWVSLIKIGPRWKTLGVFLLAAVLGCGLWFGKNWVLTGNPTYPLLYEVFDGKGWTAEKNRQWNHVHLPHDFSPASLAGDLALVGLRSEWLSPLLIPLAVLALFARRRRRHVIQLLGYFAYVIAVWWLLTHRIDRFWIPALPVVALLAGAGACWNSQRPWRVLLVVVLIAAMGSNFLTAGSVGCGYTAYFVRLESLRGDPLRVDPWHRYLNTHAAGGRVLMVGDAQVFDLEVPVLYNTCFDDCIFEQLVAGRGPAEVRAELADRGISHVYVHWGEIRRYRDTEYGFTDFVQPAVFERLVEQGVLEPLAEIDGHPGGYQVLGK